MRLIIWAISFLFSLSMANAMNEMNNKYNFSNLMEDKTTEEDIINNLENNLIKTIEKYDNNFYALQKDKPNIIYNIKNSINKECITCFDSLGEQHAISCANNSCSRRHSPQCLSCFKV